MRMAAHLQKVLNVCNRHFIARSFVLSDTVKHLKLGPAGELLKSNIYNEWYLASVIRTENVFPYCSGSPLSGKIPVDLKEPFLHTKSWTKGQLPFGIATQSAELCPLGSDSSELGCPTHQTVLRVHMFLDPQKSTQYFDEWQRSRKSWWRKISAYPSRFSLSDDQADEDNSQIHILADFSWGKRSVELLNLRTLEPFGSLSGEDKQVFEAKDGRRKMLPHVLESTVYLEGALLTFLCDAYDEYTVSDIPREVMRFHRKLAPYKANFTATSASSSSCDELMELAQFLAKQLRNVGLSVLLLPDAAKTSLESQFVRNDELGIPYTIVMNDGTLKNGIVGLRNRDTTLKEQVHITELKKYMVKLFESY